MLQVKRNFWGKKPGFDSGDVMHVGVNFLFIGIVYALTCQWGLVSVAVALVLLSKWRVLAVQPRFWLPNLKTNLVDITVGLGSVALMSATKDSWIALFIVVQYAAWLLFVKPKSTEGWVAIQANYAQTLGLISLLNSLIAKSPLFVVVLAWLIVWSAARHFFGNYEEPHYRLLSLVWATLVSQMIWFSLHWLQFYQLANLHISVAALLTSVIGTTLGSIYHTYKNEKLSNNSILENSLAGGVLTLILLVTANWRG